MPYISNVSLYAAKEGTPKPVVIPTITNRTKRLIRHPIFFALERMNQLHEWTIVLTTLSNRALSTASPPCGPNASEAVTTDGLAWEPTVGACLR